MADVDEHGRPEPPGRAGEVETLLGFLDYQRATLAWKTGGLDSAGLDSTVGASTMTLGGLLKHLALVESDWFYSSLYGREAEPPWDAVDWNADPNWEWRTAAEDSPEALYDIWNTAVERSRERVTEALSNGGGLDQLAQGEWPETGPPSLRWIVVHMIEEYARHNGHADLLRESVDGERGE
ncbi:MAG: DinB family protein [Actinomycetota bacterium]